jgi:hypothetical protein
MKNFIKKHKSYFSSINKHKAVFLGALALSFVAGEAFAADAGVVDAATNLSPLFNKIIGSVSGTLGKVIMAISLVMSIFAGVAGMSRTVILTPIGVGLLLGNAKTLIDWMF